VHHLFMKILDGKNHDGGAWEKFFEELLVALLNGTWKHWGFLEWANPEKPPTEAEMTGASVIFQSQLHDLLDAFIQTGIDRDGIETPSNRRVRASVDGPPIPIFDVLYDWFVRNKPMPALCNDGTIAILAGQPRVNGISHEQYARDMAIYYFQELLASPLWSRVGKCANPGCGRYFLRQRLRKAPIKRGTYCGACKLVGAAERTRQSRSKRKVAMLQTAAQAWNASSNRRLLRNRAAWVAAQVNKKYGKVQFVHPKWVNQNLGQIEAIAAHRDLQTTQTR
jgi:hypothetical protein